MPMSGSLRPALAWGTVVGRSQVRGGAFARAALGSVALVVAGRGFDLFAFTPDPERASVVGIQTGALVGALWSTTAPAALGAFRDPDDGWSATLQSSAAGASGLWWGAWGAQTGLGWVLLFLSMLSTSVFSICVGLPVVVSLDAAVTATLSVLVAGLFASAATAWWGGLAGALVGMGAWIAGAAGGSLALRALGPVPVGGAWAPAEVARTALLALAAVAIAQAGLRRRRL